MKRLICLISTKGKTTNQVVKEVWGAYQKYQKISKEVKQSFQSKNKTPEKILV